MSFTRYTGPVKLLPALDVDGVRVVVGDDVDGVYGHAYHRHSGRVFRVDGCMIEVFITWVKDKPERGDRPVRTEAREWRVKR
jgi:hypothetical protein